MGNDIGSGLLLRLSVLIFAPPRRQLSNRNPQYYRFRCHYPLITYLNSSSFDVLATENYNMASFNTRKYSLVHPFNNRGRWCCGRFNFRQTTLELGYLRDFSVRFFLSVRFDIFFIAVGQSETKHLLRFHGIIRLVSRRLLRRYIV